MPDNFNTTHLPNGGCNFTIAEILDLISAKFKEHVKFQDESDADALALWVAMTYVMEHLEIAPMVYVTSPEPMCGKSTVMKLLKIFCHRAEMVSKITPAAIYRLIERDQPTLVFDEADRFLRGNSELNGIINAGHARFEATVIINKKLPNGNYEPIEFPVWCAKAIAGIGKQDDTLTSRSIVISLRRKLVSETVKPIRFNMFQEYEFVRESLVAWAAYFEPISEQEMEPFLKATSDRGTDNWLALGIITKRINPEWVQRVQAALDAIEARQNDSLQSVGLELLSDVHGVVSECIRPEWPSTDLYNAVVFNEETDWSMYNHGQPITKKKFTQMLGDFGIKPTKRSKANVFYVADLEDAFERYLTHT
jgi:putative DNA primase/helicase